MKNVKVSLYLNSQWFLRAIERNLQYWPQNDIINALQWSQLSSNNNINEEQ